MERLKGRDFQIAIDKSSSMSAAHKNGKTRFQAAQELTEGFANACQPLDPDGIDVIVFSGGHKVHESVTPDKVTQVFQEHSPMGSTNTADMLKDLLDRYFARKAAGTAKPISIVVVTDGQPDDQSGLAKVIVEATQKMDEDNEIGISFIQIGTDEGATKSLKQLDDDLVTMGAKFDIVDTRTEAECEALGSVAAVLLAGLDD